MNNTESTVYDVISKRNKLLSRHVQITSVRSFSDNILWLQHIVHVYACVFVTAIHITLYLLSVDNVVLHNRFCMCARINLYFVFGYVGFHTCVLRCGLCVNA